MRNSTAASLPGMWLPACCWYAKPAAAPKAPARRGQLIGAACLAALLILLGALPALLGS